MAQEVIEVTEREVEIIEVIERGPVGPTGPQPNINYEVVSNARTLEAADLIAADTSGGAFTLTLPANPSNGDAVDIFDFSETFDTNPLTIARNGQPIESLNEDLVANVEGAYFTLIYTGSTRGWQVLPRYGTSGGGGESALTTQGDMLYRGVGINTRLPIGSAGQILKVNSGATAPEWGAAPATGVTSVGITGSDGIEVDSGSPVTGSGSIALGVNAATLRSHINVADGAEVNVQSNWTEADSGSDAFILNKPTLATVATSGDYDDLTNKPSTFTPSTHASTHATGGSDAIAPSDIGAQSIFAVIAVTASADTTLTASRAARYNVLNFTGTALNITLPTTNLLTGDVAIINSPVMTGGGSLVIRRLNADTSYTTLATITKSITNNGETFRFYTVGTASQDWRLDIIPNHSSAHASGGSDELALAASQITSGTLAHERGGLEANVSAYDGLLKISGGSTSAVTLSSAGEALLDDADAAAQRSTLGLGTAAVEDTTAFAAPSDIPDPSSATPQALGTASAGTSDDYSRADHIHGAPALNDLSNVSAAAPSDNNVLVYDNATSTWVAEAPAAGGGSSIMQSIAVGFVLN